jgi:hypothetical protein
VSGLFFTSPERQRRVEASTRRWRSGLVFALPLFAALPLLLSAPRSTPAQDKKDEKKQDPEIKLVIPLGVSPGKTTRLTVRGLKLDGAKELRFSDPGVKVKIVSKGAAPVPDKNPNVVGDTQIVVDLTVPAEVKTPLTVSAVTPAGEAKPHAVLVETTLPVVAEKEPNDGFRQAQTIQLPQVVDGVIERPKDVDVFRFEGKAGQKVVAEVFAARHGSGLDPILTLYSAAGQVLATNDDFGGTLDSRVEFTLPAAGAYFLAVQDAHDLGGPPNVYRLVLRPAG